MELALISIRQVIVFFILIMTGFFAIKAKVLKSSGIDCCTLHDREFLYHRI